MTGKRLGASLALVALSAVVAFGVTGAGAATESKGGAVAPAAKAQKKLKIGLVTDIGGLNDKSFNFLANKGLQEAKSKLGATVQVRESQKDSDYIPNLQFFAQQRFDLVIAVGFLMNDATGKVAAAFPNTKFAIIDYSAQDPETTKSQKNITGLLFKEQEAGYLVGYLAGLLEKRKGFTRTNAAQVVSSVGGLKIPPVDRYIAGFQAGAKKANPKVKTLNGYSGDFVAADKCKGLANTQLSRGSDIVFQVAGQCGLGAIDAAKTKKRWAIGVDADQAYIGPHVLASAIKRVDQAVFLTAKSLSAGKFNAGKDTSFSLKVNGVGIASINKAVPASVKAQVNKIATQIKAGKIKIPATVK